MKEILRRIPQISAFLERFSGKYPEVYIKKASRKVTEVYREEVLSGRRSSVDDIFQQVEEEIRRLMKGSLRKVINATGVVINTNLGRSPLPEEALRVVVEVSSGYSNLEYDLEEGKRGSRISHIEEYLAELTGGEAVHVVNNNAGAVFLVLSTFAKNREVVVSRGELVEIGGSFRIPDIMRASGAVLREVGTTNKTYPEDFELAIGENTAMLMKVHRSNFYMGGFTREVTAQELADLGKRFGITTYYDLGSGALVSLRDIGIGAWGEEEPTFREVLSSGIDLVSGSGDKLLGGPQAGIIAGRKELISKLKKNPLSRALRVDKMTISALQAVLRLYFEGRHSEIPVIRMLTEGENQIKRRAIKLRRMLKGVEGIELKLVRDISKPGGGSLPLAEMPTWCLALSHRGMSAQELSRRLRKSVPPVVGRIKDDRLLLDMRTVSDDELSLIRDSLRLINY